MNKAHMAYFEKDDVLHLAISDEPETGSIEISPNITAEINAKGELIGIEILKCQHVCTRLLAGICAGQGTRSCRSQNGLISASGRSSTSTA